MMRDSHLAQPHNVLSSFSILVTHFKMPVIARNFSLSAVAITLGLQGDAVVNYRTRRWLLQKCCTNARSATREPRRAPFLGQPLRSAEKR